MGEEQGLIFGRFEFCKRAGLPPPSNTYVKYKSLNLIQRGRSELRSFKMHDQTTGRRCSWTGCPLEADAKQQPTLSHLVSSAGIFGSIVTSEIAFYSKS